MTSDISPLAPLPRRLSEADELDGFVCTSQDQTQWLHKHARQADRMGSARVYVITDQGAVVGYYAICMASLAIESAPGRMKKGSARYPQPVVLLARFGVAESSAGRGLGKWMLKHVIEETVSLGARIGCRGLWIHAESEDAMGFYTHVCPDFERLETDGRQLTLLMKDCRKLIENAHPAEEDPEHAPSVERVPGDRYGIYYFRTGPTGKAPDEPARQAGGWHGGQVFAAPRQKPRP